MSSDSDALARAERVLAAAAEGAFDDLLGITPDQRDVLDRARTGDTRLNLADLRALVALGEHELVVDAAHDGRLDTSPTVTTEPSN